MAQIPDFLTDETSIARGLYSALAGAQARVVGKSKQPLPRSSAGAIPGAAPLFRPKRSGLGLGERKLLQGFADWLVVIGGFFLIFTNSMSHSSGAMMLSMVVVTALWFFFADTFDAYRVPVMQSRFYTVYSAAKVLLAVLATYTLIAWLVGGTLPVTKLRISETFSAALLIVPLTACRILVNLLLTHAPLRRRVVVVGANQDGYEMVEAINRYDGRTYEFLGYFDDELPSKQDGPPIMRDLVLPTERLLELNATHGIDQVVLANPLQTGPLLNTLSRLHEQGAQITPMFAIYQDLTGRVPVSHLGDNWYVALPANVKKTTRTYRAIKRVMDLLMSLIMLALVAPLVPLVILAIRLDSPGPIFFRQVRVGCGGKLFKIIKFRSMRQDAEAGTGAVWAGDRDPRITRVGRFLRRSRLDELPQLWNVLVGDMSFVGPRPERPEFDEQLEREVPFYRARRAVRPGLTGWAQVQYRYGNTMTDALRKVEYDLYYIKNESLYLDWLILLRTVAVVLKLGGN